MYLLQFLTEAVVAQIVQSSFCAVVASFGWWIVLRIMDRINGGSWKHYKREVLPTVIGSPIAMGIIYAGRSISVGLIWYGCFSAVRTFGLGGG